MSRISSYLDNVPVKIVEKYKTPPPIYQLPQTIKNKLLLKTNLFSEEYDGHLDYRVLNNITEWRRLRQEAKNLRQERIKKREQTFQRKAEELQKQILEAISYPSTDDLSSSESEKDDENIPSTSVKNNVPINVTENANCFYNILQPTVLDTSCPEANTSTSNKHTECALEKKLENTFNYKDFEADTSSPFDNIELKTINDLDILAQVLHNTQITTATSTTDAELSPKGSQQVNESLCNSQEFSKNNTTGQSLCNENIPNEVNRDAHIPLLINSNSNKCDSIEMNASMTTTNSDSSNIESVVQRTHESVQNVQIKFLQQQLKCDLNAKSISVPNIVKELSESLQVAALKRTRIKSINLDNGESSLTGSNDKDGDGGHFNQLDDVGKALVKNISHMGFPTERVARVALLVGFDDKKIIEHLILCSELMDIGFNETDISDALLRYNNNKEKALEDLIS